jgi:hypothetical protein
VNAAVLAGVAVARPAVSADGQLEEVVVTGTRIARPDLQSASPILSLTQERFDHDSSKTF